MDDVSLARAVHVLSVIHWIGGLSFVTLVVLPLSRTQKMPFGMFSLFNDVERRFAAQVRVSIPLAGVSGFWMVQRMDLWSQFLDPRYWWLAAMVGLWTIFMMMLFVIEPLFFERAAQARPQTVLKWMTRLHLALLAIAMVTAAGAVAGAHGFFF